MDTPLIISVDDHVVEPPDLWTVAAPAEVPRPRPRASSATRAVFHFEGGVFSFEKGVEGGEPCDWWLYDDLVYPFPKLSAAVGFPELDVTPTTFDEIRPGLLEAAGAPRRHGRQPRRGVDLLPQHAARASAARRSTSAPTRTLALLCVQAYNDWMIDEWCAGDGKGRLIPLTMVPLWDVELAAAEVRRCAEQGQLRGHVPREPVPARPAVGPRQGPATGTRSSPRARRPRPSSACTSARARRCRRTSPDAPFIVSSTLTFSNAMGSMLDYIFSGTLERFPTLKIAYSEGQVGWMPYVMERADKLWAERSDEQLRHVAAAAAVELRASASTAASSTTRSASPTATSSAWTRSASRPTTRTPTRRSRTPRRSPRRSATQAGLDDEERYKLLRGNAIKAFGLERFGITK